MNITFLYWEECMSHEEALRRVRQVIAEEGVLVPVQMVKVETWAQAEQLQFIGSPTILVNGKDIQPPPLAHILPSPAGPITWRMGVCLRCLPSMHSPSLVGGTYRCSNRCNGTTRVTRITKGAIMAALKLNEQAKPFTLPGVDDKRIRWLITRTKRPWR